MTLITKDLLISLQADEEQVNLFEEVFPQGTEITAEFLAILHESGFDVAWLAGAPLPADAFAALAKDADPKVRCVVAWNHFTPASVLADLAGDADPKVRYWVARNPNTPKDFFKTLYDEFSENLLP